MDLARKHRVEGLVNQPMSLEATPAAEKLGLDSHDKVPGTVARSRVAGMARAVILH